MILLHWSCLQTYKLMEQSAPQWIQIHQNNKPLRIIIGMVFVQHQTAFGENERWKTEAAWIQTRCPVSGEKKMHIWIQITVSFRVRVINFRNSHLAPPPSDEEDDVIGHHDLVAVLHASQSGSNLWLREPVLALLVDVVHQGLHLHRLSVSRLEHCEQGGLELLQPGGGNEERLDYSSRHTVRKLQTSYGTGVICSSLS